MKDNQMIHEIIMIINCNQYYPKGNESNKRTVCRIQNLLEEQYGYDSNKGINKDASHAKEEGGK